MASHRRRGLPRRAKLKGQLKPYSLDGAQRSVVAWLQIRKLVTHPLAFLLEVAVGITRSSINKVWMVPPKANVITLCRAAKDVQLLLVKSHGRLLAACVHRWQ